MTILCSIQNPELLYPFVLSTDKEENRKKKSLKKKPIKSKLIQIPSVLQLHRGLTVEVDLSAINSAQRRLRISPNPVHIHSAFNM